jgi:hypothetical protein
MATPVTPKPGQNIVVTTGGTPVVVVPAGPNGGFITNPVYPADQGLGSGVSAEALYVDPLNPATLAANGTCFRLGPGETWEIIPGQTTPTTVNAATSGHKFSVVWY